MTFGPRVVGKEQFAVEAQQRRRATFGTRVKDEAPVEPVPSPQPEPESPVATAAPVGFSVAEIKSFLAENPAKFDDLFGAELVRPEGARPGALREFLSAELRRTGGPRSTVISKIEEALG